MVEVYQWFSYLGFAIGLSLTIMGVFLWKFMQAKRWPISVPLLVQRDKGYIWELDERARYVTDKYGAELLLLKNRKHTVKPPKFGFISVSRSGAPVIPLFTTTLGQYFPVKITNDGVRMEAVEDKGSKNWAVLEMKRTQEKYGDKQNMWLMALPYILNITIAIAFVLMILYFSGKFELMSNTLAGAAGELSKAVAAMTANSPATPAPIG